MKSNRNSSAQELRKNETKLRTDGGKENKEKDASSSNPGIRERSEGFLDRIGIGIDHILPKNAVSEALSSDSEVETAEDLAGELENFGDVVSSFDTTRSDLEADLQATAQAYETEISEDASAVAGKLNSVLSVARSDLAHVYDFSPEKGSHSLDYSGPEDPTISTDFDFDSEYGLRTFLAESARAGDEALRHFGNLQSDMADLANKREDLKNELEGLKERNEDQLENSRSGFTNEEEQERAELISDAENEADLEEINSQLSDVNEQLQRKRPRKEDYLEIGNSVLGEVREAYESHANTVESAVRDISEEVGYLTDALDELTSVEIGSMEEMLEDKFTDTDVDLGATGKYLNDAEGDVKEAYREAVNDLTVKAARQYAQAEKAIEELETLEDAVGSNTDRLDLGYTDEVRSILDDSYDGDDFESYLENNVDGVLDATFSARDEIRNVFRGLEEIRDEEQLA